MSRPEDAAPEDAAIERLSALCGILPDYYDIQGNRRETPIETKRAILLAMGIRDVGEELRRKEFGPWLRLIEPVLAVSVNAQPSAISIRFPLKAGHEGEVALLLSVEDEKGYAQSRSFNGISALEERLIEGRRYVRAEIPIDAGRDIGYYNVSVKCETGHDVYEGWMLLIVAPDRCYSPPSKTWGLSLSLYSLRSDSNWGVGDLGDLDEVMEKISKLGGGFVGINPLHAIPNRHPYGLSPYYPISRLYRNFIYLDIGKIDFSPALAKFLKTKTFSNKIETLRRKDHVDYDGAAAVKEKALRRAFSDFKRNVPEDFLLYVKEEGKPLEDFSAYMALRDFLGKESFKEWPKGYQSPDGPRVKKFKEEHKEEILFYQFAQWLIDRRLMEVSGRAAGMPIGIYGDLAVGSAGHGSDAWGNPEVFAVSSGSRSGASTGAPPDAFNPNGQNWGFPPFIPEKLKDSRYELFIETIRKNLKYCGAIRIDHALGLFRLFWIPEGMDPAHGAYVRYPFEDLLRIIALESVRNKAVIIAEDLGIVTDEARKYLQQYGMLSYRLFYFEKAWGTKPPSFLPPEAYPELAVSAVTTHDLPTIYGYWAGRDIEVKKELGIYADDEAVRKDLEERKRDRQLMLDALKGFLPSGFPTDAGDVQEMTPELMLSIYRYLARTPSRLVSVSLDDLTGALDQQNLPGTMDEHPNWRRKAPLTVNQLFAGDRIKSLSKIFL